MAINGTELANANRSLSRRRSSSNIPRLAECHFQLKRCIALSRPLLHSQRIRSRPLREPRHRSPLPSAPSRRLRSAFRIWPQRQRPIYPLHQAERLHSSRLEQLSTERTHFRYNSRKGRERQTERGQERGRDRESR
jgi:hypothetical protein